MGEYGNEHGGFRAQAVGWSAKVSRGPAGFVLFHVCLCFLIDAMMRETE
jgi:hypothetical protein